MATNRRIPYSRVVSVGINRSALTGGKGGGSEPPQPPEPTIGSPIGLLLALTYSAYVPPAPQTGQPIGLLLSLTKAA